MDMLQVRIDSAGYEEHTPAVEHIEFTLKPGELIGLIGPNGAGKSTTIKSILGLMKSFKGEIRFPGERPNYAYIPEHPVLYEELTLWEHLEVAAAVYELERDVFIERAEGLLKLNFGLIRQLAKLRFSGWRLLGLRLLLAVAAGVLFFSAAGYIKENVRIGGIACLLLAGLFVWLVKRRLRVKGAFYQDMEREYAAKMRIASLLLSGFVQKKRKPLRKRPFLLGRSQLLFRHRSPISGLSEVCIKSFLRSPAQIRLYLQYAAVAGGTLLLPLPSFVRWIVWLASAFLLSYWMKSYCKEVAAAPFLQLFPWTDRTKIGALRKCTHLLMLPAFMVLSLLMGFVSGAWVGVLFMAVFGFAAAYFISAVVTIWY
jgi:energy-coupling factor transporter ATP-binding protein EcfA2